MTDPFGAAPFDLPSDKGNQIIGEDVGWSRLHPPTHAPLPSHSRLYAPPPHSQTHPDSRPSSRHSDISLSLPARPVPVVGSEVPKHESLFRLPKIHIKLPASGSLGGEQSRGAIGQPSPLSRDHPLPCRPPSRPQSRDAAYRSRPHSQNDHARPLPLTESEDDLPPPRVQPRTTSLVHTQRF